MEDRVTEQFPAGRARTIDGDRSRRESTHVC